MALLNHIIVLFSLLATLFFTKTLSQLSVIIPFTCIEKIPTPICSSYLYHSSEGFTAEQIASYYSVNTSQIKPIKYNTRQDYLVSVPCGCIDVNGTVANFYDTSYTVQKGDTLANVTTLIYNGQAFDVQYDQQIVVGQIIPIHLVCGCLQSDSQVVVTYTVQVGDTLSGIAASLASTVNGIENLNKQLISNPSFLDVGWVLFVPMNTTGSRGF
ncbi:hypothetical protein FRX31_017049 [Thalictrum thalictroides]|uniref:LysM domain-containing protein n=1 Tax=Thalictrum thalictroides TaxID=46969 RepID=A0A7J6W7H9_THATH|nr:hypothetical protein FRX31_017049 [Thalictrum thalictroides]